MSKKTTIINYGAGNIKSIINVFEKLNINYGVSQSYNEILESDFVILPGVGNFSYVMQILKESNQENLIQNIVNSMNQFDRTQENLDELVYLSKQEILRMKPLIEDLSIAAKNLNDILENVNDKENL